MLQSSRSRALNGHHNSRPRQVVLDPLQDDIYGICRCEPVVLPLRPPSWNRKIPTGLRYAELTIWSNILTPRIVCKASTHYRVTTEQKDTYSKPSTYLVNLVQRQNTGLASIDVYISSACRLVPTCASPSLILPPPLTVLFPCLCRKLHKAFPVNLIDHLHTHTPMASQVGRVFLLYRPWPPS